MTNCFSEKDLSRLSDLIAAWMGLYYPVERHDYLAQGLQSAADELGFEDNDSFTDWLSSSSIAEDEIKVLATHLTVGETYFFRDKNVFGDLEKVVLPKLIESRRTEGKYLRIWCAGCSTGEEPYSIAILLTWMIRDIRDWNISILATDINPRFLRIAADGKYGRWSFRDVPSGVAEVFFNPVDNAQVQIVPGIKNMVKFKFLNLVEDAYPSLLNCTNAMDIIFCRNVLMYFEPKQAMKVIKNLHRCLIDDGCLVLSPSELSQQLLSQFSIGDNYCGIAYKKKLSISDTVHDTPLLSESVNNQSLMSMEIVAAPDVATAASAADSLDPVNDRIETKSDCQPANDIYGEALYLYLNGYYSEAAEKTKSLLMGDLVEAKYFALLARICANLGKLKDALQLCEKAIDLDKLDAGMYYLMSTILIEMGRPKDAVRCLRKSLYINPKSIPAYITLGNLNWQSGRHKESSKYFSNALSLLGSMMPDETLPDSEGVSAGRLMEIIQSYAGRE